MFSRVTVLLLGICLLAALVRTKPHFKRNNVRELIERLEMGKQTRGAKRQSDGTMDGAMNGIVNGTKNGTMNSAINGTKNGTIDFAMNDTVNGTMDFAMNGTKNGTMNSAINGTKNGTIDFAMNDTMNGTMDFAMNGTKNGTMNGAMNGTENGTMDGKGKKDDDDKKGKGKKDDDDKKGKGKKDDDDKKGKGKKDDDDKKGKGKKDDDDKKGKGKKDDDDKKGKGKKDCDCGDDDDDEKKHAEYLAWWNYQLELFGVSPPWLTFYDFLKNSTKEKIKLGAQVDCAEDDYNCLYYSFLEYYFVGNPWWWDQYNFQPNWLTYDVGLVEYFGGVVPFWYNEEGPSYGFDEGFALWAHLTINIMQDFLHSYVVETCFGKEPKPEDFGWLEEYGYIGESALDVAKGRWEQLKDFFSWDVKETCLWLPFAVFKE